MKHVHSEVAKAKLDNMELVVFSYCNLDQLWSEDIPNQPGVEFIDSINTDYFLCLPKHREACLHWLNGGKVESLHKDYGAMELAECGAIEWGVKSTFMKDSIEIRIKPKKEKRWIAYTKDQKRVGVLTFDDERAIRAHYGDEADSFHEIEVEV